MPRTASKQNLDKAQQRPSARLRPPNVIESAPVLFRLPAIEQLPVAMENTEDEVQTEASQSLQLPEVVAAAEPVAPAVVEQAEPAVQLAAEVETEAERSWWEHWSSGVVLILLIIALITASIVAFSDAASTDPDLLADFVEEDGDSLGDLSSIKIPDVQMPTKQSAQMAPVELPADSSVQLGEPASVEVFATTETEGGGLVLGDLEFDSLELTPGSEIAADSVATAQESGSEEASVVGLLLPNLPEAPEHKPAAQSSVSLSQPVGIPPLPLFPNPVGAVPGEEATPQMVGQSPALYDEALTNLPLPAAILPTASSNSMANPPVDTQQPAYSSLLTSSSSAPSFTTASHQTGPQSSEVPPPEPTDASSAPSLNRPGVQKTGTPESEADAIIRAWQEFNALNQSETSASNRYVPNPGSNLSTPTSGGVQAYTLGNSNQSTATSQSR